MTRPPVRIDVTLAQRLGMRREQAAAAVELLDAGNTLPIIARYRKEATGGLDDAQLRTLAAELKTLRALEEQRASILASITKQGLLSGALEAQIRAPETLTTLEDLYLPYRPKRKTRASVAREKGLQGLADRMLRGEVGPGHAAEALQGARDIVAETVAERDWRDASRSAACLTQSVVATAYCLKSSSRTPDLSKKKNMPYS